MTTPAPFAEALQFLRQKKLLPTALDSAGIAALPRRARNGSMISAKTLLVDLLETYKTNITKIVNPVQVTRADRITETNPQGFVTEGLDLGQARLEAKTVLAKAGYQPDPEKRGTIQDLGSKARMDLVLKTNRDMAQGYAYFIQGQDPAVLDAFPAQELVRIEDRDQKRDWSERWLAAARSVNDEDAIRVFGATGRMIARKDSPVWEALGAGAGGFESDALGNPFEPFAFNSGVGLADVDYSEALELGLVQPGQTIQPQTAEFPIPEEALA